MELWFLQFLSSGRIGKLVLWDEWMHCQRWRKVWTWTHYSCPCSIREELFQAQSWSGDTQDHYSFQFWVGNAKLHHLLKHKLQLKLVQANAWWPSYHLVLPMIGTSNFYYWRLLHRSRWSEPSSWSMLWRSTWRSICSWVHLLCLNEWFKVQALKMSNLDLPSRFDKVNLMRQMHQDQKSP